MPRSELSEFRILVVDDEPNVLDLMAETLAGIGWTVERDVSPVSALDLAKRRRFDALVLDLYMPELPGMLFHAKLRVYDPELAERTVFVTGYFSRQELRADLEIAAKVLMKPFEPEALVEMVKEVLPPRPRRPAQRSAAR